MPVSTCGRTSELKEFRFISRQIYLKCKDMKSTINATGFSNEVYEDIETLSWRLNEEVDAIEANSYKGNHSLYVRVFKLVKIIKDGIEDYEYISKRNEDLLRLINGLIGGAESFERFLSNVTEILKLMRGNRLGGKSQTRPLKRIEKLCHILDRVKSEEGPSEARLKSRVDFLLKLGVRDLARLVEGCRKASNNCPDEPRCGLVLRVLRMKGYKLSYDKSGLFHSNGDPPSIHREIFNRWDLSHVPISYVIPQFAILSNGEVVFKSFDNEIYKIAGKCRVKGWASNYWRPAEDATVADERLIWRRFFPPCSRKRAVRQEAQLLGFWAKLANENSEDHKRKVSVLRNYMSESQLSRGDHVSNPRKLAADLSDLSIRGNECKRESRLLENGAYHIKRSIIGHSCLLSNLNGEGFASWVVKLVSHCNLSSVGRGDVTIWGHLSLEGRSGPGGRSRFSVSIRRSAGRYFEDQKCDVEVTLNVPSAPSNTVITSTEHLAKILDDLPAYNKRRMYDLSVFYVRKLLVSNWSLKRFLSGGNANPGPQMFSARRVMEMKPLSEVCSVLMEDGEAHERDDLSNLEPVRKQLRTWNGADLDDIPSPELLKMGQELTDW